MAAKSQDNIELYPQVRTFFKQKELPELISRFEELKLKGTLEEEAQLEQDRARALSYVLYDKFKRESSDRNIFDAAEFERLYGMSEEEINKMIAEKERARMEREELEGDEDEGEGIDDEGHRDIETGGERETQEKVEKAPVDPNAELDSEEESESEEED